MAKFVIEKIESADVKNADVVQRLYDLGLYPGLEVEIVGKVSFGSITIVEYSGTRLALNSEEFSCLHGH